MRRRPSFAHRFLAALAFQGTFVALALTAAGRLAAWHWRLDLMSHFPVQLAIALSALALAGLALGARRTTAAALAGAVLNAALVAPLHRAPAPSAVTAPAAGGTLRLLTFNVLTSNPGKAEVAAYLADRAPDALVLLETDDAWAAMARALPGYRVLAADPRDDNFGLLVAVREGGGVTGGDGKVIPLGPQEPGSPSAIEAELGWAGRSARLLAVHSWPPRGEARSATGMRQLQAAAAWAASQSGPILVAGDLNATPWSAGYRGVMAGGRLRDSLRGFGPQGTWPDLPRLPANVFRIPIDHVLHSEELVTVDRRVGPSLGSDHRAVEVELRWR